MSGAAADDRLDATALAALVRSGEASPRELVDAALARIDARDPAIGAVVRRRDASARAEADALGARLRAGDPAVRDAPFAGVPLLVKDLLATLAGEPTGQGNRVLRDLPVPTDSTFVARLRRAGLVPVGRTATPELGLVPWTEPECGVPVRNPWAPDRSPGGSSGGSAAAVAARMVAVATGGDGGGSIRIPASCCGLFGFKPSRGLVPTGPVFGEVWAGFVVEHVLTRSVRDSAALLDAVAGDEPGSPYAAPRLREPCADAAARADPGRMRIAFTLRPLFGAPGTPVAADCVDAVRATAGRLAALGHELEEAAPPIDGEACASAFVTVLAGQTAAELAWMSAFAGRPIGPADVEPATWTLALVGRALSADAYVRATGTLAEATRATGAFLERHDALLTPTLARPPIRIGELALSPAERFGAIAAGRLRAGGLLRRIGLLEQVAARTFGYMPFTPLFNVTGSPAMSLPLHATADGLPVGVQVAGALGDDARLFALAAQLERAAPWAERVPPAPGREGAGRDAIARAHSPTSAGPRYTSPV
jgi:amidase